MSELAVAREAEKGALSARPATHDDLDAFLHLARLCALEAFQEFDEDEARHVFGGLARCDPAIHVLEADKEMIGFSLVRTTTAPFTKLQCVHEELLFVRADKRSVAAELLLHGIAIAVFKAMDLASVIDLYVANSLHAPEVIEALREHNFTESSLRMQAGRIDASTGSPTTRH